VRSKNPAAEFIQEAGSVSPSPGGEGRDEGGCSPKVFLVGTAFSFVHLLDELAARDVRLELPPGSQVLETGGYKGRSRVLQKSELHALITERLGVPQSQIICEYGMSELSSQAYQTGRGARGEGREEEGVFQFPPWVRARVVSPETGGEVADGATGLLSIVDLANVFSVMAIQTEDLAIRRGAGFELLGRAALAEPRGCSLTSV
jgi:acyl-CoA synthetase (AMP-forming)/AMP-acid ligase II